MINLLKYLGRLTSTEQGRMSLERQDARSMLLSLLGNRMDVYLKLVVSCVDYRLVYSCLHGINGVTVPSLMPKENGNYTLYFKNIKIFLMGKGVWTSLYMSSICYYFFFFFFFLGGGGPTF